MNGAQRHPPNTASPLNRTGVPLPHTSGSPRPSGGLLPNITASLRNVLLHNNNALNHAISQLEVAGDIQSELVAARAAHAKVSMDLRRVTDENMAQGLQLQQAQTDLTVMNQKLHGAREQLRLLESRIANGAGGRSSAQEIYAKRQIEILNLAFGSANQQINELTKKLQMATSAAIVAQTSDSVLPPVDELGTSSARVQDVGKQLAALLKLSDDDFSGTPDQPIPAIEMNTNGEIGKAEKLQILAYFRTLCSECDNLRNSAQAYASRNAALEATLSTIRTLHAAPIIPQPSLPPPTPIEGDGEVQMDIERTEAARASRQITQPPTPTQSTHPIHTVSVPSVPTTPSQSTFPQTDIPQRKRQRTSTEASTPEPLPRDDMLHAFVRIVNTTYELKPNEANEGQKRLVCKWCEKRHKEQPEYTVVSFPYDQELPITVPPLPSAELTRTLVRPWVEHVQERHQKVYAKVVENFERIKVKMAAMPARP